MVNGKRTDVQIAQMLNSEHAIKMLQDLQKLGYVSDLRQMPKAVELKEKLEGAETALLQQHLVFIKTFLIEEAQLQLGLMSREIEQKVALVQTQEDLKACIPRWHMAIRDSRNGRTVADKLMERLAHLLANPPQVATSEKAS